MKKRIDHPLRMSSNQNSYENNSQKFRILGPYVIPRRRRIEPLQRRMKIFIHSYEHGTSLDQQCERHLNHGSKSATTELFFNKGEMNRIGNKSIGNRVKSLSKNCQNANVNQSRTMNTRRDSFNEKHGKKQGEDSRRNPVNDGIEEMRKSEIEIKASGIKHICSRFGNQGDFVAEMLKKIVGETGIRDLTKLKLYKEGEDKPTRYLTDSDYNRIYPMGSFERFPDVKNFKISIGKYDGLMALFNLKRRFSPIIEIETFNNKKMNRYVEHQVRRLDKALAKGNNKLYGRICKFLMKRSRLFYIMQLNKAFPNGHRKYEYGGVIKLYKKFLELARYEATDTKLRRVYIPKDENKSRPLGVPAEAGRVYSGMYARFIQHFLKDKISKSQHAYQKGKGTKTAGEQIGKEVVNSENIFEFDLKGFFDSINQLELKLIMEKFGIPEDIAVTLFAMNTRVPDGVKIKMKNESLYRSGPSDKGSQLPSEIPERKKRTSEMQRNEKSEPIRIEDIGPIPHMTSEGFIQVKVRGQPQGLGTSPILSILALEETLIKRFKGKIVMYADDGIVYGGEELTEEVIKNNLSNIGMGITINGEKSGGIKRDNKWMKPLKFLGLKYDGNILQAETRSGSELKMTGKEYLIAELGNTRLGDKNPLVMKQLKENLSKDGTKLDITRGGKPSISQLVKSKLGGLIQARLYTGSFEAEDIEQDFSLNYKKGSGMYYRAHMKGKHGFTVFNSTSFAAKSLYYKLKEIKGNPKKKIYNDGHLGTPHFDYNLDDGVGVDDINYQLNKTTDFEKQIIEIIKENIEYEESERNKYKNPNRRERKGTKSELKRRRKSPLGSGLYKNAYYRVIRKYGESDSLYSNVIDPYVGKTEEKTETKFQIEDNKDTVPPSLQGGEEGGMILMSELIPNPTKDTLEEEKTKRMKYSFAGKGIPPIDMCLVIRLGRVSTKAVNLIGTWGNYILVGVVVPIAALLTVIGEYSNLRFLDELHPNKNPTLLQTVTLMMIGVGYTGYESDEIMKVGLKEFTHVITPENNTSELVVNENESNIPIICFGILVICLGVFVFFHSETMFVAQQNSTLEGIVRDQATTIEGQHRFIEHLLEKISRLYNAL